jgi:C1A family cysteine protease
MLKKKQIVVSLLCCAALLYVYVLYSPGTWRSLSSSNSQYNNAKLLPYSPPSIFRHKYMINLGRPSDPQEVLPTYFKWREKLLVPIRSQGQCASCWAFSVCDSMADRISLHTRGAIRNTLSVQELLSCYMPRFFPCHRGGIPEMAYQYVIVRGLLQEDAYPYENFQSTRIGDCRIGKKMGFLEGWNVDPKRHEKNPHRIYAQEGTVRNLCSAPLTQGIIDKNIENMKVEIMTNGPIVGTIEVYDDLYSYDAESVYEVGENARLMGGHAVEIYGWSDEGANTEESGFEGAYWLVRNSWGDIWPRNLPAEFSGWFYVRMGRNEAGIESRASAAQPMLTDAMVQLGKSSSWLSGAYTSYQSYVDDPERHKFFAHLAKRRNASKST